MNILQEPLLIFAAPDNIQAALGMIFASAAVTLIALAVEAGLYPSARQWFVTRMNGDFWIRRQWHRRLLGGCSCDCWGGYWQVKCPQSILRA